jgi:deoxyribodipyrimidine photo-lyase
MNADQFKVPFPTDMNSITGRIQAVDPVAYARTRNFLDGAVSRLSPYISRGVISTRQVMEHVLERDLPFAQVEKYIQELAWRDYWQQIWLHRGEAIDTDLRRPQSGVTNRQMPLALIRANTGIEAIDDSIRELYSGGYLHNHVRMYIAALACNIGGSHWLLPARWMYYHLRDGDWASNALSWQWVAGSNSKKKYLANQDNINKYCRSSQRGTFLDVSYDNIASMEIPDALSQIGKPELSLQLPATSTISIEPRRKTLLYNYYNLDPHWHRQEDANRILLLEPSVFTRYPVAPANIAFARQLAGNIPGIQLFVGEFTHLHRQLAGSEIFFKEHPLNRHYQGNEEPRQWMFSCRGDFSSFFAFLKRGRRELNV